MLVTKVNPWTQELARAQRTLLQCCLHRHCHRLMLPVPPHGVPVACHLPQAAPPASCWLAHLLTGLFSLLDLQHFRTGTTASSLSWPSMCVQSFSTGKTEKAEPAEDQALLGECSGSRNTFSQSHPGHATQLVGSQFPDQRLNTGQAVKAQTPNH